VPEVPDDRKRTRGDHIPAHLPAMTLKMALAGQVRKYGGFINQDMDCQICQGLLDSRKPLPQSMPENPGKKADLQKGEIISFLPPSGHQFRLLSPHRC